MRAHLIHRVKVSLVQVDSDNAPATDPQFREPSGRVRYLGPIVISAQLGLGTTERYRQRPHGDDQQSDGHIVVMAPDLRREAPGVSIAKGDRIEALYVGTTMERAVSWVILEVRPSFHYRGAPGGWQLFYGDLKTQRDLA